ncbi:MAG: hypothetical protein ACTIJH_06395 [Moraxellaceae bacterium]
MSETIGQREQAAAMKTMAKTLTKNSLSKREQFACAAMQGLLANRGSTLKTMMMKEAILIADEMIEELDKSK